MADLVKLILYSGPSVLLILAGLVYGKKFIEYFFDETIELKKLELNQDLEKFKGEIELSSKDFQHDLDTKLNAFNIKFSKLHQERAEVIKQLYYKLIELHSSMIVFTRRIHPIIEDAKKEEDERILRVNKALEDFNNYYMPHKIFFNKDIGQKLDNISREYWDKGWDFAFITRQFRDQSLPHDLYKDHVEKSKKITEAVENDMTRLIEELENEFRLILGVE